MTTCKPKQMKLCGKDECKICFERSFASYNGKTEKGKLKIDCWDNDKNGDVKPINLRKGTNKEKSWFKCDICYHIFEVYPNDVTNKRWCPYCSKPCKKLCEDKDCEFCYNNSFASCEGKTPNDKLKVDCWSSKNTKKPSECIKYSGKIYIFDCDNCHHDFVNTLDTIKHVWCPYCSPNKMNRKLCEDEECKICFERSFASYEGKTPNDQFKVDCWSSKNTEKPREVFKSSNTKYIFDCNCCPHSFPMTLSNVNSNNWCPYCAHQKLCEDEECKICFEISFASYEGKTPNDKLKVDCWSSKNTEKPREVFKSSNTKYIFDCNCCPHSFPMTLGHINGCRWCPYCSKPCKKLCEDEDCEFCYNNSFSSCEGKTPIDKLKVDCWSSKNTKKPREVFKSSNTKYEFKCDNCPHSFPMTLSDVNSNYWCPYCSKPCKKLCEDKDCEFCYNKSFASYEGKTHNGKLKVNCWNNEKNKGIKPRDITISTSNKYWFDCDICLEYFETLIANKTWCPICKNKTEKKFLQWLKDNFQYKIIYQSKYDWCKSPDTNSFLPFDFCIEELKLIIEVDGRQHFEQISNWNAPEDTFEHDEYKMKQAKNNGYSMIRIFQEDIYNDKNDWENKTKEVIKLYDEPTIITIGCEILYKKYNSINNMEELETEEKPHKCEKCNICFKFKSQLERHSKSELHITGKKKTRSDKKEEFKCPHCDLYTTKQKTNLKLHILNNHKTKEERKAEFSFYCVLCDSGTLKEAQHKKHLETKKHKKKLELSSK
jgi:hypothetical protein